MQLRQRISGIPAQGPLLSGIFCWWVNARQTNPEDSANSILEIGTLGAYSTKWLARALPVGGKVVTIECNERHAEIARRNIARAGLHETVDLHVGRALDVLPVLSGPFDMIFIDADKSNTLNYMRWALQLARPGAIIVNDNVVRGGAVADPSSEDANVKGVREGLEFLANEARLDATAIQTVGEKGWDGFSLAIVRD